MKPLFKFIFTVVIIFFGQQLIAQPGLNVQNRITSKVQTRAQGKVLNTITAKAATQLSAKVAKKASDDAAKKAAASSSQKIASEIKISGRNKKTTQASKDKKD